MAYRVGQRIEVLDQEPGMETSYHAAAVLGEGEQTLLVEFETLNDSHGNHLTDHIAFQKIRPYPDQIDVKIANGETVDAWYNGAWRIGRLRRYDPNHPEEMVYRVHFQNMLDGQTLRTFTREHIRLHQEFEFHGHLTNKALWAYHRITGYHHGQRIEIIGQNTYHAGKLVTHLGDQVFVEYETLPDVHGYPTRDVFNFQQIRPYPATIVGGFESGDRVEVFVDGGWWRGTYEQQEPDENEDLLHSVILDNMPEDQQIGLFATDQIRLHQQFYFDDPSNYFGVWAYARM